MAQYLSADLRDPGDRGGRSWDVAECGGAAVRRQHLRARCAEWLYPPGRSGAEAHAGATGALGPDRGAGGSYDAGDRRDAGHHPGRVARAADHPSAARPSRSVPRSTTSVRRHRIDIRQKKTAHASRRQAREDVAARREAWFDLPARARPGEDFIDETGATTKMARLAGEPAASDGSAAVPHGHWKTHHAGRGPAPRRPHGTR